jgi:thioredoxin-related protein
MQNAATMRTILALAAALALALPVPAQPAEGRLKGGVVYALPAWFKPSFLDLREDVREARERGRHVMLFLHLDECPYCERMLRESFVRGANHDFMRAHFDVIGLNIRGALEVTGTDGARFTERSYARHVKVFATPTIVFLDREGGKALQLTGYRDPAALRQALEYVHSASYRRQDFAAYLAARERPALYALREHPLFSPRRDFKGYRKPLAVLFEDRQCAECARFHERTLNRPEVLAEMKRLLFVRLDAGSDERIVTPDGKATTPARWAKDLGLTYRPSMVLFDEGREIFRIDARLYHFHFKEALRYASGGHHRRYAGISAYNAARREELRKRGVDIDYSE